MTEAEWLACTNPVPMVEFVRERVSKRKWALYRCAGCRHITHLFYDPKSLRVIEVLERYVDGKAGQVEMDNAAYFAESPTFGYAFEENFWTRYPDKDREILWTLVAMGALSESALSGGEWRVNKVV